MIFDSHLKTIKNLELPAPLQLKNNGWIQVAADIFVIPSGPCRWLKLSNIDQEGDIIVENKTPPANQEFIDVTLANYNN